MGKCASNGGLSFSGVKRCYWMHTFTHKRLMVCYEIMFSLLVRQICVTDTWEGTSSLLLVIRCASLTSTRGKYALNLQIISCSNRIMIWLLVRDLLHISHSSTGGSHTHWFWQIQSACCLFVSFGLSRSPSYCSCTCQSDVLSLLQALFFFLFWKTSMLLSIKEPLFQIFKWHNFKCNND